MTSEKKKLYVARVGAEFDVMVEPFAFDVYGTGFERKERDLPTGLNGAFASELPKVGGFTKTVVLAETRREALAKLHEVYRERREDAAGVLRAAEAELLAVTNALTGTR